MTAESSRRTAHRFPRSLVFFGMLKAADPADRAREGRRAARSLYGAILVLAVLLTTQEHAPGPWQLAAGLAFTVTVILAIEAYADVLGQEIALSRPLTGEERRAAVRELVVVTSAAEGPLAFFVLAGIGLISERTAFVLARWVTIALLFTYGFLARRLAGHTWLQAARAGFVVAGLGVTLALAKSLAHL